MAGQRRAIEEYAREHSLHLARVFVDEARSGGTDQREQFQLMMQLAHQDPPPCSTILVWSWSRFARDQDDAHYWKASLRRHGVDIRDISGETPDVPTGFEYVLESLIHWKDAQKLVELSRAIRRGQQTLVKLGYVPSGGQPPRGFRVEFEEQEIEGRKRTLRHWAPDPDTWPSVERAWQMRLHGRSYKDIWREVGLYRTPNCFSTFFNNPIYKGELRYGESLIEVPAVVTPEEWNQVNKDRAQRRGGAYPRRQGSRFLLSGLLTCARCGSTLIGDRGWTGKRTDGYVRARWACYLCPKKKRRECDLPRLKAELLEEALIDALFDDILTEDNLIAQWARIEEQRDAQRPSLEAQLRVLRSNAAKSDRSIGKLLDAIEIAPNTASLAQRLSERESERERTGQEIADIEVRLAGERAPLTDIREARHTLRLALGDGPTATARLALKQFVAVIIVDYDTMRVKYKLPFQPTGLR